MPTMTKQVPNPWAPYIDGNIWCFTQQEYNAMPRFIPAVDPETLGIIGWRLFTQEIGDGNIYVKFSPEPVRDWNAFWGMDVALPTQQETIF